MIQVNINQCRIIGDIIKCGKKEESLYYEFDMRVFANNELDVEQTIVARIYRKDIMDKVEKELKHCSFSAKGEIRVNYGWCPVLIIKDVEKVLTL